MTSRTLARFVFPAFVLTTTPPAAGDQDPVRYVNPLIGSNNFKGDSEFAGLAPFVTAPFGMTNFTPQTRLNSIGSTSYLYKDTRFKGFLATHQPAIWMGDYGYVNVMPQIGTISPSESGRALTFDYKIGQASGDNAANKEELSTPYYYQAKMGSAEGKPITAEMTATERCAIYRFRFPANHASSILVESARDRASGETTIDVANGELYGWNSDNMSAHLNDKPPRNLKGYFVVSFSKPIAAKGTYIDYQPEADRLSARGRKSGGYITFTTAADEWVEVRIGTSFISVDQARKNIAREIGTKTFDTVKTELKNVWNEKLDTIRIEGATPDEMHIFHTAMFHALMYPRMFYENVNGTDKYYSPFDDTIHDGRSYTDFSIWDTFRAQNSLLTIVAPERIDDMVRSLLQNFKEGGYMPKWPNPNYTNIMIGTHADSIVAEAINKGFKGFDRDIAYAAVYKDAMIPQAGDGTIKWKDRQTGVPYEARAGLSAYKELGYVPNGYVKENVSNTIEGAYDDWCVAQVAKAAGKDNEARYFLNRSLNYRNVIHPDTGYAMGRDTDGRWSTSGEEFTEGDRRKYTWFAPHDPQGLQDLMARHKGPEFFNTELERAFGGQGGKKWIEHQNEPCHHYAYMFDFSDRPDLAQKYARQTLVESYFNDTSGMLGNDDCGQMSSWYVFSAMGFYPVNPASGEYMIGSPIFDKVTITNPVTRAKFEITAPDNDGANLYIRSARLNGKRHDIPVVTYKQITTGGKLEFAMASAPSAWARDYRKPALAIDSSARSPEPRPSTPPFGDAVVRNPAKQNLLAAARISTSNWQPGGDLGDPATTLVDGRYDRGYASAPVTADQLRQHPHEITIEWNTPEERLGTLTIHANYATQQGPKTADIEVRHPAGSWQLLKPRHAFTWKDLGDHLYQSEIGLTGQENVTGLRLRITEANLAWNKIAIRELQLAGDAMAAIHLKHPTTYQTEILHKGNLLTSITLAGKPLAAGRDYTLTGDGIISTVIFSNSVFARHGPDAQAELKFTFDRGTPQVRHVRIF